MKSTPTPHTKTGCTTKDLILRVGGPGRFKSDQEVPAGTRCHFIGHWVVDDLSWMARDHYDRHDAEHYGITVPADCVTDIKEV